ncbi:acyl-CoA dehydrogenase family protein [Nocardioides pantholopis]|uniref:acyl-CoA dehydrogenase family protein n=1 Tax=Nocardioides pantholopis TaxID=2483798 RepID=UPI000F07811A|nr:acyl-CoA dehydrogenase family protein [Nocardioides pantholopis]
MTQDLSPDEVRVSLRAFFADRPGVAEARRIRDAAEDDALTRDGFDRDRWARAAEQLGLAAMGVPEHWGGLGLDVAHLVAAVEECGTSLYPGPARAALLAGWSLAGVPAGAPVPEEVTRAVDGLLAGDVVPGWSTAADPERAPRLVDGRLTGTAVRVTHGHAAGLVLCLARTDQGPVVALAAVSRDAARIGVDTIDLTTPRADVVLRGAPAVAVTAPHEDDVERHLTVARLLLAAEQVGGAEGCLAAMVSYAAVREQFGTLIGTYQAIQHRCSDIVIHTSAARGLVTAGAAAVDGGEDAAALRLGLLARAEAGDCFLAASSGLIQVSGGLGFTWEHDAHLFFRRARATASVGGTPEHHRHRAVEAGCLDLLGTPTS